MYTKPLIGLGGAGLTGGTTAGLTSRKNKKRNAALGGLAATTAAGVYGMHKFNQNNQKIASRLLNNAPKLTTAINPVVPEEFSFAGMNVKGLGHYNNIPVYRLHDDLSNILGTGMANESVNAFGTIDPGPDLKRGIYVNSHFDKLPSRHQESILAHEARHVTGNHDRFFGKGIFGNKTQTMFQNTAMEFDADKGAIEAGLGKELRESLRVLYTQPYVKGPGKLQLFSRIMKI